jgi:N-acetylglucosaminyldiphosphoundecaprenol N-acetyl-beta-D-mannosaminyltransferase
MGVPDPQAITSGNNMKTSKILGFDISTLPVNTIVSDSLITTSQLVINTLNPHSYVEQKNDKGFSDALLQSDILIPDGSGIVIAAKLLNKESILKVAGYDLFYETMQQLNKINGKIFFLGSTDNVLTKIINRANKDFPNVEVEVLSPEFKSEFNNDDIISFSHLINQFCPDVVFVGLTAPKQEKLINQLKHYTDVKFFSGIGAVFDFYAGTVKRSHKIWINLHLEWLPRLIMEPKRLWKRNFVSTPIFIIDVLKHKIFGEK